MSPEEAQEVMRRQVHHSAVGIANNRNYPITRDHHEVCILHICHSFFGPKWFDYTREEQWAKRSIISEEYHRMLTHYLPIFQQFQHDSNNILRLDEVTLATIFKKTSPTEASAAKAINTKAITTKTTTMKTTTMKGSAVFNEPADSDETDDEILNTTVAKERDEAARKNLYKYYEPCQQGRKDLRIRRAKEPEGNIDLFDHNDYPLNDDKKTRNCPECGKAYTTCGIKRHYQITHAKDPRWVIYCPAPGCKFECWRGDATILSHMAYRHEDLHRETFGEKDVQKQAEARQKAREKVNARRWAKVEAEAEAKGSKPGVSEGDQRKIEQTELTEDHLRGEALDHEDVFEEEVHDKDDHDAFIRNEDIPNTNMSHPNMPRDQMANWHIPNPYTPTPYMPNSYISSRYMPNQHMHGQHMSSQHVSSQHMPSQHMTNPYMPNRYVPTQHTPTQHTPTQYMPTQHMLNPHTPNRYMANEETFGEDMVDMVDKIDWAWSHKR